MNLLEVRTWLIKESSRYELVKDQTTFADNGANNYIRAGQVMLDDMQDTTHGSATNMQILPAGESSLQIGMCRAVHDVYCMYEADGSRWKLKKGIRSNRRHLSAKSFFPPTETGAPQRYEEVNFRFAPESGDPVNVPANYMVYLGAYAHSVNGIRFDLIADVDYIVEVDGSFYTEFLTDDASENFWTYRYPHLLVMASQCIMEMFSRNTEGVKDWINAIKIGLQGIDHNLVERDIANVKHMEG